MIIETSAIIAILQEEDEAQAMLGAMEREQSGLFLIASPSFFETSMVIYQRAGEKGLAALARLEHEIGWHIEPFTPTLSVLALEGYKRFHHGKNGLNFGDCFSYALARARGDRLLCKGDDFKRTDVELVSY